MISLLGPEGAIFYNTLEYEFKNYITLETGKTTTTKDSVTTSLMQLEYRQKQENRQKKFFEYPKLMPVRFHYL